jgi:hypothetical protein
LPTLASEDFGTREPEAACCSGDENAFLGKSLREISSCRGHV